MFVDQILFLDRNDSVKVLRIDTNKDRCCVLTYVCTFLNVLLWISKVSVGCGLSRILSCQVNINFIGTSNTTRMHSSRMRTVRSSSCLSRGGWSASVHAGIPPPRSRRPSGPGTPPEQTPPRDQAPPRPGTPLGADPRPGPGAPHCGQTHTCKNITFATLLRTVKIMT